MELGLAAYGLSFVAGGLSTLSPCVLPLAPVLLGAALTASRFGPYALASGLMLSFTAIGVFVASLGGALGLDQGTFRSAAATLLMVFGVVLLSARLQQWLASATSGLSGSVQSALARMSPDNLAGQFLLGLLLGVVWVPCIGPTLGAAVTLASQGQSLGQVALLMALFGLGAAAPLLALGMASRAAAVKLRGKLLAVGEIGKRAFGWIMLLIGGMILSGADKRIEAWVLEVAPPWLVQLTTSI